MTESMQEALSAFKQTYRAELAARPGEVVNVNDLDEIIEQAKAEMGAAAMAGTIAAAVDRVRLCRNAATAVGRCSGIIELDCAYRACRGCTRLTG